MAPMKLACGASALRRSSIFVLLLAGQASAVHLRKVKPREDLGLKGFQDGPVVADKLDYNAMVYSKPYVSHQNADRCAQRYMYVGCTFDIQRKENRWYHKEVPKEDRQPMTPDVCWDFCHRIPGTQYFGLENGDRCYCTPYYTEDLKSAAEGRTETNAFWTGKQKHSDADLGLLELDKPAEGSTDGRGHSTYASTGGHFNGMCDMPCVGRHTEMCGGKDYVSMFTLVVCEGEDGGRSSTTSTTTTNPDPCLDYGSIEFDFFNAILLHNNLGGIGPREHDVPELRYANIGVANGKPFDIVITTLSGYQGQPGANGYPNGEVAKFGTISVKGGTEVKLTFTFRDSATDEPVEVPGFYFSFFDLDGNRQGTVKEEIEVWGYKEYALSKNSTIEVIGVYPGHYLFRSTKEGYFCDNPRDPMQLGEVTCTHEGEGPPKPYHPTPTWTMDQREHGVTFTFEKKESFEVRLSAICDKPDGCQGRNFLFAGRSFLVEHCPTTPTTTTTAGPPPPPDPCMSGGDAVDWKMDFFQSSGIIYNNLMGLGPNVDDPQEIRYGHVGEMNGMPFDLVVTAPGQTYKAANINSNGLPSGGKFGNINVLGGVGTDLKFTWMLADTNEEVKLPRFYFTFFDLDQSARGRQRETLDVSGFTEFVVSDPTDIEISDVQGGKRFKSTQEGHGCDNPRDPAQLGEVTCTKNHPTVDQKKRSVMFTFEGNISSFTVHYDVTCNRNNGNPAPDGCTSGRNLLFAGESAMTDICEQENQA